jgi:hypothetical protein
VKLFEADVALHVGDHERAIDLLNDLVPTFWWREPVLARRAEILAFAGRDEAAEALAAANAREAHDPIAVAMQLRARAAIDGDDAPLRQALEIFERIECVYESARTRWLLGGADREAAREAFARLGAVLPSR